MTTIRIWVDGARPRTLSAGLVPVAVGAAAAVGEGSQTAWWRAGAALVVGMALQVAVNFANDYSDGVRGTDDSTRVGPRRLVGSGLVAARSVKRAAFAAFGVAMATGAVLAAVAGWELLAAGAVCIAAGWAYTGGPKPYGYLGLGEMFVFVFFGLVATAGTTYVLLERLDWFAVLCGVPVGLWAVSLLMANNLRDIVGDGAAGKRTLAVRLGDRRTRVAYMAVGDGPGRGGRGRRRPLRGAGGAQGPAGGVGAGSDTGAGRHRPGAARLGPGHGSRHRTHIEGAQAGARCPHR